MDKDRYENPLPHLTVDINSLSLETKDRCEGKFYIRNTGGSLLKGRILTRCPGLELEPKEWEGNRQTVQYTWDASKAGLSTGETLDGLFYITSNGGETEIPVTAKLTKMSITTHGGFTIANIKDFYDYALNYPSQAKKLFTDSEFYMLLMATSYRYLEVYESLHKDANRERAMDNFFILSGLKGRTTLDVKTRFMEFKAKPGETGMIYSRFKVEKSDAGYVEAPISIRGNAPWLTLSSGKLSASDFNDEHVATVNFSIDPMQIKSIYASEQVIIGAEEDADNSIEITYHRTPPLVLRLNREAYRYEDKGAIQVVNNTGVNIQAEVFCPDNYIRFNARRFAIGNFGEVPFEVKLSPFLSAQLMFRKLPYMETVIEIRATAPGQVYKKKLPVTVGEW